MSAWDFFDRVFCINLRHRTDRLKRSVQEFKHVGLTGRVELLIVDLQTENPHGFASPGFWGNLQSHRQCLVAAHNKGSRNVLIFEDDVEFYDADFEVDIKKVTDQLPHDWRLLYLGSIKTMRDCRPYSENLLLLDHCFSVHAIAVNGSFFEIALKCLDVAELLGRPVDSIYCDVVQKSGKCYLANPMLVQQADGYSDAWESHRDHDW